MLGGLEEQNKEGAGMLGNGGRIREDENGAIKREAQPTAESECAKVWNFSGTRGLPGSRWDPRLLACLGRVFVFGPQPAGTAGSSCFLGGKPLRGLRGGWSLHGDYDGDFSSLG